MVCALTDGATGEIKLHDSAISLVSVNAGGTLGATANQTGTIVRVFDCSKLEILHELRRGASFATISSLAFNANSSLLACASNKATIHIWSLQAPSGTLFGLFRAALPKTLQPIRSDAKI
jgi:WD40 repeat protein